MTNFVDTFFESKIENILDLFVSRNDNSLTFGAELSFIIRTSVVLTFILFFGLLIHNFVLPPLEIFLVLFFSFVLIFIAYKMMKVLNVLTDEKSICGLIVFVAFLLFLIYIV